MNVLRNVFKSYQKCLHTYPLLTQCVSAGTLMGVGDIIAQTFVEKNSLSDINPVRTARFAAIGLCVAGPCLRTWYLFLDRRLGSKSGTAALKKVLLDQFVFAPVFIGVLLTSIGLSGNKSVVHITEKLIQDYPTILVTNYYVWPFVQVVNFYMIPLNYQVLVVQTVAIFWNTYLSWKANRPLIVDLLPATGSKAAGETEVILLQNEPTVAG